MTIDHHPAPTATIFDTPTQGDNLRITLRVEADGQPIDLHRQIRLLLENLDVAHDEADRLTRMTLRHKSVSTADWTIKVGQNEYIPRAARLRAFNQLREIDEELGLDT